MTNKLFRALEMVLAIAFIAMVLLNFANVVGRYGFSIALNWADEVQVFAMVALTFLGAAIVAWRRRHLRMDVLALMLPPRLRTLLSAAEALIMVIVCSFAAWQAWLYTASMFALGRASDNAGIPMWIVHGTIALGLILLSLVAVMQLRSPKPHDEVPVRPTGALRNPGDQGASSPS
jgi:TRAP-type transport system small permease protein